MNKWLKDSFKRIKSLKKIKSIGIVIICKGEVQTAYFNANLEQKQLMASHIQMDVVDQFIMVNKERYNG